MCIPEVARRPPARVLCVDDNQEVGAALAELLRGSAAFHCVGCLGSAAEMLGQGPGLAPDLVLLDLGMPGADAIEVLPRFLELAPEARVVVLSGRLSPEIVNRAIDAGAWGYVSKEDGLNEIVRCLREVASGKFAFSQSAAEVCGYFRPPEVVVRPVKPPSRSPGSPA